MMLEKNKQTEIAIMELLKSPDMEDQIIGCRLAIKILGKQWCENYLGVYDMIESQAPYYIKNGEWGVYTYIYLEYVENYTMRFLSKDITILDITNEEL